MSHAMPLEPLQIFEETTAGAGADVGDGGGADGGGLLVAVLGIAALGALGYGVHRALAAGANRAERERAQRGASGDEFAHRKPGSAPARARTLVLPTLGDGARFRALTMEPIVKEEPPLGTSASEARRDAFRVVYRHEPGGDGRVTIGTLDLMRRDYPGEALYFQGTNEPANEVAREQARRKRTADPMGRAQFIAPPSREPARRLVEQRGSLPSSSLGGALRLMDVLAPLKGRTLTGLGGSIARAEGEARPLSGASALAFARKATKPGRLGTRKP